MSMLSAQCAELRDKAKLLRGHADGLKAPYVIPSTKELMALTMLDSAMRMEEAADTILSLRDRLQAAELGSGTCENIAPEYLDFLCSKCGFVHYHSDENDSGDGNDWAFCPNCGKEVDENANDEDSREKLENDIWAGCDHLTMLERGHMLVNVPYDKLLGWLDRQAAITERTAVIAAKEAGKVLREKIAELQAQLDETKAKPDCDCCEWQEENAKLRAQVEHVGNR